MDALSWTTDTKIKEVDRITINVKFKGEAGETLMVFIQPAKIEAFANLIRPWLEWEDWNGRIKCQTK